LQNPTSGAGLSDTWKKAVLYSSVQAPAIPTFTTDTAAALRAIEIEAEVILKGTRVAGIYDSDPETNPDAEKFDTITGDEILKRRLNVMDLTAFTLCRENETPIIVFDMNIVGNLKKVVCSEEAVGSTVVWDES
jgi:uridylate kinase